MGRIDGLDYPEGKIKKTSASFLSELLKKFGLQEKRLYQMGTVELKQELEARNLSSYSSRLRTRIEVLILILGLEQRNEGSYWDKPPANRLLASELLIQAITLARNKGKSLLGREIGDYLEKTGLKGEREQIFKAFSRLLQENVKNRSELRILLNQLDNSGFLGLQRFLRTGDYSRLNRVSATRFLALEVFLNYLLEGDLPRGRISQPLQGRKIELDLPEVFNQMLLTVNRYRLHPLARAFEDLSLWAGQELAQAAREETFRLTNDQRFSPGAVEFIIGRLNKLVFGEKGLPNPIDNGFDQQEKMQVAILLRNNYPAIYRYHRQLGLPFLALDEEESFPRFGPCFIAGAVLTKPEDGIYIEILRFWRSRYLGKSDFGLFVIKFYNKIGPVLAMPFSRFFFVKKILRGTLIKVADFLLLWMIKKNYQVEEDDVDVSIQKCKDHERKRR